MAQRISGLLENYLGIGIPKVEVGYIAMHLKGAQMEPYSSMHPENDPDGMLWIDLAQSLVRTVENQLGQRFSDDEALLEGLVSHLVPAVNRLRLGLQIHNPMLDQIKDQYPDVYKACKEAADFLSAKTGYRIPDAEIGYLAMHMGAALLRKKASADQKFSAIVVCASGIGTSRFLASRLKKEFPNVQIQAVVSASGVKDWIESNSPVDMIASTVALPSLQSERIIIVTPFVNKKDLNSIRNAMDEISVRRSAGHQENRQLSSMLSVARYGEGLVQLLRNLALLDGVLPKSELLLHLAEMLAASSAVSDSARLAKDLAERETLGGFVLHELAMIHAKTSGVRELLAAVFRLQKPVAWKGTDGQRMSVHTVLLLAAPCSAPSEHLEMISEISASLVEESFVETLCNAPDDLFRSTLQQILSAAYFAKTDRLLKEP